jgi:PhzF family phenazine biosynthesis protein
VAEFVLVDAFAERPFTGNPAGVCVLAEAAEAADEAWMQALAAELQLPATAFVWPAADGFCLRWFTATTELSLCGHGTLASAHALLELGHVAAGQAIRFESQAGVLVAQPGGHGIELDFPAEPSAPIEPPADLLRSLSSAKLRLDQTPVHVERNRLDVLVELASEDALRVVQPDLALLRRVPARGVILTARAGSSAGDFVSRFFAPSVGIDEDAVTGSAHCCLAPYWHRKLGKTEMVGLQLSRRGGVVHVQVNGERVRLGGQAVTVLRGTLASG